MLSRSISRHPGLTGLARLISKVKPGRKIAMATNIELPCVCGPRCYGEVHCFKMERTLEGQWLVDISPGVLAPARVNPELSLLDQHGPFNRTMDAYHARRAESWREFESPVEELYACQALTDGLGQQLAEANWPILLISGQDPEAQAWNPAYYRQNCKFVRPLSDCNSAFLQSLGLKQWLWQEYGQLMHPRVLFAVENGMITRVWWDLPIETRFSLVAEQLLRHT